MPKIRRVGGLTNATARGFVSPADELRRRGKLGPYGVEFVLEDEPDGVAEPQPPAGPVDLGDLAQANPSMGYPPTVESVKEEKPWPGNSSETSPAKPPKNDEPRKPSPRKRARSAGAPSGSTEASGTAPTGTTSGPVTGA